jgi:hypothetical protein
MSISIQAAARSSLLRRGSGCEKVYLILGDLYLSARNNSA